MTRRSLGAWRVGAPVLVLVAGLTAAAFGTACAGASAPPENHAALEAGDEKRELLDDLVDFDAAEAFEAVLGYFYETHGADLEEVAVRLRAILEEDEAFVPALFGLGLVANLAGELDEAERYYVESLELEPGLSGAHLNVGVLLAHRGEGGLARQHFEAVLEQDPQSRAARQNLRRLLGEDAAGEFAMSELERALESGMQHWLNGERRDALRAFDHVIWQHGALPNEERALTREVAAQAKFFLAEDVFESATALVLDGVDDGTLRKQLEEKLEWTEMARELYMKAISYQSPQWAVAALYRLGESLVLVGEAIMETPIPERLTVEQVIQYQEHLDAHGQRLIDEGMDIFLRVSKVAKEKGIVTDFTYKAALLMHQLRPQEYHEPARLPVAGQVGADGYVLSGFRALW